jgi:hypothetical protein
MRVTLVKTTILLDSLSKTSSAESESSVISTRRRLIGIYLLDTMARMGSSRWGTA